MRIALSTLVGCAAIAFASAALAQGSMLAPPDTAFLKSKGSWGQKYSDQWALHRVGFDLSPQSAWRLVKQDASPVIVALIDTGLDWNHRSIDWATIWRNPKETEGNNVDDDKNGFIDDVIGWDFFGNDNKPWDYDGHGTFVAGIIAGSWKDKAGVPGINPFARLMVLKGINNFGHSRSTYIARAIAYAADNGARVINLSVGGKQVTEVERAAIEYAFAKGAVLVAAAGNEGADITNYGLAASDKVLAVASTGFDDQRATFSNWGKIALAAPGLDVLSLRARRTDIMMSVEGAKYKPGAAYVGVDKRYYRASGTSFSAPMVSGLASLMIANNPDLTNVQVMNILKSTARDAGTPGVDQYSGYGIIDARAALQAPKDYLLFAGISRVEVVQAGGAQAVRVRGTADANQFKSALLEVGQGENPKTWKRIGPSTQAKGPDETLGDVPASAFAGAKVWHIRVLVTHQNGSVREARFRLNLG